MNESKKEAMTQLVADVYSRKFNDEAKDNQYVILRTAGYSDADATEYLDGPQGEINIDD